MTLVLKLLATALLLLHIAGLCRIHRYVPDVCETVGEAFMLGGAGFGLSIVLVLTALSAVWIL